MKKLIITCIWSIFGALYVYAVEFPMESPTVQFKNRTSQTVRVKLTGKKTCRDKTEKITEMLTIGAGENKKINVKTEKIEEGKACQTIFNKATSIFVAKMPGVMPILLKGKTEIAPDETLEIQPDLSFKKVK